MMQVHWLRVMLDEGDTLGTSLNLTNKLETTVSLTTANRWLSTGTPTPNTPNSQLSHLQPMLKFLHEYAYGQNKKSWEAGILRPFEAEMEEGRSRLLDLLHRCMISANKKDLQTVPPRNKAVTFLNFAEEHQEDGWNPDWELTSSSEVTYLVKKLKALRVANRVVEALPEKVLIFSQYCWHRYVIEQQLTVSGVKFASMYCKTKLRDKKRSLELFQHDASCLALVMDESAELGLDLSVVTHVFIMEPIWDRRVEEQVISRADRMGATRPALVETLAMCGTVEELMIELLQDPDKCKRIANEESNKTDLKRKRSPLSLHDLAAISWLAKLSFVQTNS